MPRTNELSNMRCEKAAPRPKPYRIADKGGLYLLVAPTGGKLWRWKYRFEGKEKSMAFGRYPDVPLAQARLLHAKARALLAAGVDPMAARKEAKQERQAAQAERDKTAATGLSFEDLAQQWFAWWKADKNQRYAANVESRLGQDVLARIGRKRPEEIKRMELVELTQEVGARGARDIARRNLQIIRQIFTYGMNQGLLDQNLANPAAGIEPSQILARTVEKHFPSLELKEVPELLRKMRDYSGNALTRLAMELIGLTVLRTSELIGGQWEEIDWEAKRWNVPAARMKMKTRHIVPLSRQALGLLERLYALSGKTGRIFPDYNGGAGTMSNNTILKALERMGYKGRMTGHGWRSIFSTYLREHGFNRDHVETQLAHLTGTETERAYNYALYLEARARMMQHWADHLDTLRAGRTQGARAA